jgi:hypothetical protein
VVQHVFEALQHHVYPHFSLCLQHFLLQHIPYIFPLLLQPSTSIPYPNALQQLLPAGATQNCMVQLMFEALQHCVYPHFSCSFATLIAATYFFPLPPIPYPKMLQWPPAGATRRIVWCSMHSKHCNTASIRIFSFRLEHSTYSDIPYIFPSCCNTP